MEKLLTPEQAAKALNVHPITVRRWLREGVLRGEKRGKRLWRVPESALSESPQKELAQHEPFTLRADDSAEAHNEKIRALITAPRAMQEAAFAAASEAATLYYASEEGKAETEEWQNFNTDIIEYSEADLAAA